MDTPNNISKYFFGRSLASRCSSKSSGAPQCELAAALRCDTVTGPHETVPGAPIFVQFRASRAHSWPTLGQPTPFRASVPLSPPPPSGSPRELPPDVSKVTPVNAQTEHGRGGSARCTRPQVFAGCPFCAFLGTKASEQGVRAYADIVPLFQRLLPGLRPLPSRATREADGGGVGRGGEDDSADAHWSWSAKCGFPPCFHLIAPAVPAHCGCGRNFGLVDYPEKANVLARDGAATLESETKPYKTSSPKLRIVRGNLQPTDRPLDRPLDAPGWAKSGRCQQRLTRFRPVRRFRGDSEPHLMNLANSEETLAKFRRSWPVLERVPLSFGELGQF